MSTTPNYAFAPRVAVGLLTTANTARDGSGTPVSVFAAGAGGSRIDLVTIQATGASTTPGMVRLFVHDGTNARLFREVPIPAVTPSGTQPAYNISLDMDGGLVLPSGWSLRATTHLSEAFNVIAVGGDF